MLKASKALGIAVFLLLPTFAGAAPEVETNYRFFVTAPDNGRIFLVEATINQATRNVTKSKATRVFQLNGTSPTYINLGPNGRLYIVNGNQILRQNGNQFQVWYGGGGDPTGLGDLYARGEAIGESAFYVTAAGPATSRGLWRFDLDDPTDRQRVIQRNLNPAGSLKVALMGPFVGADGANLFRVSRDPNSHDFVNGPQESLSLGGYFTKVNGVATLGADNDLKAVIGQRPGGSHAIALFDCSNGLLCTLVPGKEDSLGTANLTRDIETSFAGDQFYLPTASVIFTTTNADGKGGRAYVWDPFLDAGKRLRLLKEFQQGKEASSIWGIAIPPDNQLRTGEVTVAQGFHEKVFNCFASRVTVSFTALDNVRLREVCSQGLPGAVNQDLLSQGCANSFCTQYESINGACTIHDTQFLKPNNNQSGLSDVSDIKIGISYVRELESSQAFNPIVCDDGNVITEYHASGQLGGPDPDRGSRRFTDIVADQVNESAATFVGFFPDIALCGPDPANGPFSIVTGNQIPVRPAFNPVSPDATLQLSITCFEPGPVYYSASSVGNTNFENFFRFTGNKHEYNLDMNASTNVNGNPMPIGKVCALDIWGDAGAVVRGCIKRQ